MRHLSKLSKECNINTLKLISLSLFLLFSSTTQAYFTQQGQIYEDNNHRVVINGVSWSGFQDTNVLQGLQSNPFYGMGSANRACGMMALVSQPWNCTDSGVNSTTAAQFKTVRLPIQPDVLYDTSNEVDLNKGSSDKRNPKAGNGIFCKTWQNDGNACEKAHSPREAFWIVLEEMQKQNIKVLIDIHHRNGYGDGMRDGTVYDMAQYTKDLTLLAQQIKSKKLDNVIGIDIFNEPYQLNWFVEHNGQVPWSKVISTAANAIFSANPDLLLFVEGPDTGNDDADNPSICVASSQLIDDPNGYWHYRDDAECKNLQRVMFKGNWGEDFKPLLNQAQARLGLAEFDKNKLATALTQQGITKDALDWLMGDAAANNAHLVFSPHVYPAEVAGWQTQAGAASNLRFDWTWGFLYKANYPVVLGEASWKTQAGKTFFTEALMAYMQQHMGTSNVFFWGIGYLGDTISLINVNNNQLNLDAAVGLRPYFNLTE